jgi:hypothetical protein
MIIWLDVRDQASLGAIGLRPVIAGMGAPEGSRHEVVNAGGLVGWKHVHG